MHARHIDPRDQRSEDLAPAYRVYFWHESEGCAEFELTNTDLDEVLAWIEEFSGGRTHSLWITARLEGHTHVARLRGIDPPAPPETWPEWAREVR